MTPDTKALYSLVADALAGHGREVQEALEALMGRLRDAEKEREEDQGVIRVWRGRTQRAEADNAALLALLHKVADCGFKMTGAVAADVDDLLRRNHPGAALLEELEGLRKQVSEQSESLTKHRRMVEMQADRIQEWKGKFHSEERKSVSAHNAALEELEAHKTAIATLEKAVSIAYDAALEDAAKHVSSVLEENDMDATAREMSALIRALKKTGQGQ